jgi:hypothetical protein
MNTYLDEPDETDDARQRPGSMNVLASGEVRAYVRERGGRLYVWTTDHRCCRGTLTLLDASTTPPERSRRRFERLDAGGFALYFAAGGRRHPDELVLELKGRRHSLRAYWNNCAYVI